MLLANETSVQEDYNTSLTTQHRRVNIAVFLLAITSVSAALFKSMVCLSVYHSFLLREADRVKRKCGLVLTCYNYYVLNRILLSTR